MFQPNLHNEIELLNGIAKQDEASFNSIYDFYSDRIYSFCLKMVKNETIAEDLVQDVFTKLWRYQDIANIENLYAWLRTLARNQTLKLLKRRAIELKAAEELAETWNEQGNNTEQQIDFNDLKRLLDQAVAGLSEHQRRVYMLCKVDGLSYEDAAKELGISKLTVQTHMKRSLSVIRKSLAQNNKFLAFLFFLGLLR